MCILMNGIGLAGVLRTCCQLSAVSCQLLAGCLPSSYKAVHRKRPTSVRARWKKSGAWFLTSTPPNMGAKLSVSSSAFQWCMSWGGHQHFWWFGKIGCFSLRKNQVSCFWAQNLVATLEVLKKVWYNLKSIFRQLSCGISGFWGSLLFIGENLSCLWSNVVRSIWP